eukprot:9423037-Pyramimonas_sp.AAC.1
MLCRLDNAPGGMSAGTGSRVGPGIGDTLPKDRDRSPRPKPHIPGRGGVGDPWAIGGRCTSP